MSPDPLEPVAKTLVAALGLIVGWTVLGAVVPIVSLLADVLRSGVVGLRQVLASPAPVQPVKFQAKVAPTTLPEPVPKKKRRKKKQTASWPAREPPRPEHGPRVQRLNGDEFVPWRVHLDECASSCERKQLLVAHGFHVTMTHEVGLLKASDRKQLNYAIRNRAVIVTFDRDFLAFHDAGERHSGIIHSPQDPAYDQEILRVLLRMSTEVAEV